MGFIDWWKNESKEESASQLDLLGQAQELAPQRNRVDGATVFKRFTQSIKDNGGEGEVYEQAVTAETIEIFDCTPPELYKATGGKRGKRDTLPQSAHSLTWSTRPCQRMS